MLEDGQLPRVEQLMVRKGCWCMVVKLSPMTVLMISSFTSLTLLKRFGLIITVCGCLCCVCDSIREGRDTIWSFIIFLFFSICLRCVWFSKEGSCKILHYLSVLFMYVSFLMNKRLAFSIKITKLRTQSHSLSFNLKNNDGCVGNLGSTCTLERHQS